MLQKPVHCSMTRQKVTAPYFVPPYRPACHPPSPSALSFCQGSRGPTKTKKEKDKGQHHSEMAPLRRADRSKPGVMTLSQPQPWPGRLAMVLATWAGGKRMSDTVYSPDNCKSRPVRMEHSNYMVITTIAQLLLANRSRRWMQGPTRENLRRAILVLICAAYDADPG